MTQRIFSIAPGAPFLKTCAEALLDGRIVEGFSRALGPLALADATLYVPTRRAARALNDEFSRALGGAAALLPRILPLGALEDTETSLLFDAAADDLGRPLDLPAAIGDVARRMALAELILAWAKALHGAIVSVDADRRLRLDGGEPALVATTAADAWHLAGELAGLIDELIIEGVDWRKLDSLVLPEFDDYWRITLVFLDIAIGRWPEILAERGLVDRATRQLALIEKQRARLEENAPGQGAIVAIGSTGSNPATARLLKAIAASPRGAVVLPGLDRDLDSHAFAQIGRMGDGDPSFTHPQAALARLLRVLGVARSEIRELGLVSDSQRMRAAFVSQALRPAESTDAWLAWRETAHRALLDAALAGVSVIEAADEREEALCIAIAMREMLETAGQTAALVTPNRGLARRVAAELRRWGISVDDSGGDPLGASPAGFLARLVIACAGASQRAVSIAALLAHPGVCLGLSRQEIQQIAPLLEIGVLRTRAGKGGEALFLDPAGAIACARKSAADVHAHPARRRLSERAWARLQDLLTRLADALRPITGLTGQHDLRCWLSAHRAAIAAVAEGAPLAGDAAEALDVLFDEFSSNATDVLQFDAESYAFFFAAIAGEAKLRGPQNAHPRLKILGLLEARLMDADLMLLGGLDETVWPPQARADAFLNRPMRAALGLTPPERKLGQTAHDFTQAMGRRRVILSRAAKRDGAPTVASRFLQRMAALGGDSFDACIRRGAATVAMARLIDRPQRQAEPLKRPLPRPPIALRPARLSVTKIETFRRDPYALYAETILRLTPLDPLAGAAGVAEAGSAIHAALDAFVRNNPAGPLGIGARAELLSRLRDALGGNLDDADYRAFAWPRLERAVDGFLAFEASRRGGVLEIKTEIPGSHEMTLADGSTFTLTARADRIDFERDGQVTLIDYKTGSVPTNEQIRAGFSPQLTLEAAMAQRGAFAPASDEAQIVALYLKFGGSKGFELKPVVFEKENFADVVAEHYAGLAALLNQFRDAATPYPPRPYPQFAKRYNSYDHLARVMEWSVGGEVEGGQ